MFLLNNEIQINNNNYSSDSDLNIWTEFVNNSKNIKDSSFNKHLFKRYNSDNGTESTLELFYI